MSESDESNNNNLYILFAVLVVILIGVAYARLPAFRSIADAKAPWFKEKVGHYLVSAVGGGQQQGTDGDASAASPSEGRQPFNITTFAAHPDSWPPSIAIKVETEFPAVVNGKKVGSVRAPAGSQVHLVKVENGKLGVEYKGGGAWLAPEATDLMERVQAAAPSHP